MDGFLTPRAPGSEAPSEFFFLSLSRRKGFLFFVQRVETKASKTCRMDTMRQRKSVLKFTHALNPETKSRMLNCLFLVELTKMFK